jgi:alkylation response protein AidB-like acyl-CoA dehydrogenase
MNLSLTPEQEKLQKEAREFLAKECPWTLVKEADASESGFSKELWKKIGTKGWLGFPLPQKYGGGGASLTDTAVLYEEMGRVLLPGPYFSSTIVCGQIILEGGTEEQKEELIPAMAKGKKILALAFTEPDDGWGAECIHLSAAPNNGGFVLNGKKRFVHDAQIADQVICVARTKETVNPEEGITLFLVDMKSPGLSCRDLPGFVGEKQNELTFDSVKVPSSRIIGDTNRGWSILNRSFTKAIPVLCAFMVGGCQHVFEMTVDYSRRRMAFGQNIGFFQWVQTYVINQTNDLESARWTMYEAVFKIDAEKPENEQAIAVSLAKAVASDAYYEVCSNAHEVQAGRGIQLEYPLYLYTKKARTLYTYLGDPSHHRRLLAQLMGM